MNTALPKDLRKLRDFLLSDAVIENAMQLSALDGFLAGVIVCPDLIKPSEWMTVMWGGEPPMTEDLDQAQDFHDLLIKHYNGIIRRLDQRRYSPLYDTGPDGRIDWESWIGGFWTAMLMRPDAWRAFGKQHESDEDVLRSVFVITRLVQIALPGDDGGPMEVDEELLELAPDLIPRSVEILHHARLAQSGEVYTVTHGSGRVGRNDPCPCGSGKKYKKCCLH